MTLIPDVLSKIRPSPGVQKYLAGKRTQRGTMQHGWKCSASREVWRTPTEYFYLVFGDNIALKPAFCLLEICKNSRHPYCRQSWFLCEHSFVVNRPYSIKPPEMMKYKNQIVISIVKIFLRWYVWCRYIHISRRSEQRKMIVHVCIQHSRGGERDENEKYSNVLSKLKSAARQEMNMSCDPNK